VYLVDTTVAENIALGVPPALIDRQRVHEAATAARISETIEGWENKYNSIVGERGIRLSGGERQRIGIARALYKRAEIIVFDEATSALDYETENEIGKAIDSLSDEITCFIVTHRLSTLRNCDIILAVSEQGVQKYDGWIDYDAVLAH